MLVISGLSLSFPVWSQLLNFLSHLRHSARLGFCSPSPPFLPALSLMVFIVSLFALLFRSYFSLSCHFWFFSTSFSACQEHCFSVSNPPFCYFLSLMFCILLLQLLWSAPHLHHKPTEDDYPVKKRERGHPPPWPQNICPICDRQEQSQLSITFGLHLYPIWGKKLFFQATPEKLPQVLTRSPNTPYSFLESDQ